MAAKRAANATKMNKEAREAARGEYWLLGPAKAAEISKLA